MQEHTRRDRSQPSYLLTLAIACLVLGGAALLFAARSWARPASPDLTAVLLGPGAPPAWTQGAVAARIADQLAERLELTDDQQQELHAILADHSTELADGLRAVKDRRIALFEAIHDHPPAETDVRDAATDLAAAQSDLAVLRAQIVVEVRQVLTPEQLQELDELRAGLVALADFVGEGLVDRLTAALAG